MQSEHDVSKKTELYLKSRYPGMDTLDAINHNAKRKPLARKMDEWLFAQMGPEKSLKAKIKLTYLVEFLFQLSTWRGWLGFIIRPILILLGKNAFWHFQEFLWRIEKRKTNWCLPSDELVQAKEVVEQLKSNGIATLQGIFSNELFLRNAKQDINALLQKAHEKLNELPDGIGDIYAPPSGHRFVRDAPLEYCGRTRIRLSWTPEQDQKEMPEWMVKIVKERQLLQIAENYFGVPVSIKRYTIDELIPAQSSLEWHTDTVHDCLKTFIFLEDCKPENGYTKFRTGTHRMDSSSIRSTYYLMHKYGPPFHYPGPIQYVSPGEIIKGVGLAGDSIFLTTRAFHAAANCILGRRLILVISYTIHSNRNKILSATRTL